MSLSLTRKKAQVIYLYDKEKPHRKTQIQIVDIQEHCVVINIKAPDNITIMRDDAKSKLKIVEDCIDQGPDKINYLRTMIYKCTETNHVVGIVEIWKARTYNYADVTIYDSYSREIVLRSKHKSIQPIDNIMMHLYVHYAEYLSKTKVTFTNNLLGDPNEF